MVGVDGRRRVIRAWSRVTVLALVAALGACSLPLRPSTPTSSDPAEPSSAPQPSSSTTIRMDGGPAPAPSEPPVGTREMMTEGMVVTTTLYPLVRDGQLMWLTAKATVTGPERRSVSSSLWSYQSSRVPDGWRIVAPGRAEVHLPAVVDRGAMCGPDFSMVMSIETHTELWFTCGFGALPDSVTEVTVQTANFGVFENVPVR